MRELNENDMNYIEERLEQYEQELIEKDEIWVSEQLDELIGTTEYLTDEDIKEAREDFAHYAEDVRNWLLNEYRFQLEEEHTLDDEEEELAERLEERGYGLVKRLVPRYGRLTDVYDVWYSITDKNNVIVTGDTDLDFNDVVRWIEE